MRVNREKFASALVRLDINGKQLSQKTGLSRSTITAVRTGKSCSKDTMDKLLTVLGEDILEGK